MQLTKSIQSIEPSWKQDSGGIAQNTNDSLDWSGSDWLAVALLALGGLLAIARFWQPGIASEADMLYGIYRVFELDQAWSHGILYPRLSVNLNFGYSAPLFQFYPPLASYGALVFHWAGLGWIESTKLMFTVALLLSGLGAYTYARWLFRDRRAAFVAGAAYLFAPYLLTNVYERGALAETLALGLLPWVFWGLHRALEQPQRERVAVGAILVALLMLAHNITALFGLPVVVIYLALTAWYQRRLNQFVGVVAACGLGLGLSAFYWVPALAEVRYTRVESSMLSGRFSAAENLVQLKDLVQSTLVVDHWGPNRFRLALWQAVVFVLAVIAIPFQAKAVRFVVILLAGIAAVALIMQLTVSRSFWEAFPLVRFVQFPWRLLGLASFCIALVTGSLFLLPPLRTNLGMAVLVGLIVVIVPAGLLRLQPDLSPIWSKVTNEQIGLLDLFERGRRGTGLFNDYTPIFLQVPSRQLSQPWPVHMPVSDPQSTAANVEVLSYGPNRVSLLVETESAMPVRLSRVYFPGWRAYVDGERVPTEPTGPLGLVGTEVPAGDHRVEFRFGNTPLRSAAATFSLASLGILIWIALRSRHRTAIALGLGVAVLIFVLLAALSQGGDDGGGSKKPEIYRANFQDEVSLLGYHLPTTTWKRGQAIPVDLFWLARTRPAANYRVFLHLAPPDDSGKVAQSDSTPMLGYNSTLHWESGEVIRDHQELELPDDIPPGRYLLLMGIYEAAEMRNLAVSDALQALPGDRVVLSEIEVTGE